MLVPNRLCVADHLTLGLLKLSVIYSDCFNVKDFTEFTVDSINCSPLIYQANHLIKEVYQVGQVLLLIDESMLTTPDNFFVLHVPEMFISRS